MAQPLSIQEEPAVSGLEEAVFRLERAFQRMEHAVSHAGQDFRSLTLDNEKLNHLLQDAEDKILRLREVAGEVSTRLDRTIDALEALE